MNLRIVAVLVGNLLTLLGALMAIPLGISICMRESDSVAFLVSIAVAVSAGLVLRSVGGRKSELPLRECIAAVSLGWIAAAAVGALPFLLSGSLPTYADAFFEAMSGLTTTGATVINDVDAQPHGILFWRSFTHWLGGMGIIVLFIAVLPGIGAGAARLFRAEVPGITAERLEPRIKDTAKALWFIYLGISVVHAVVLCACGMSLFDSINHTFATMGTGGFSTRTASVGAWDSPAVHWTITAFMVIAGGNFSLYYRFLRTRRLSVFKDAELICYLCIIIASSVLIAAFIHPAHPASLEKSVRDSFFQVSSIITTTGYATVDFDAWPPLAKGILVILMFVGGCTGSTGGGMKVLRIMILVKHSLAEVFRSFHPRAVTSVKVNGIALKDEVLSGILGFGFLYAGTFVVSTLAIASLGLDLVSSATGVAATLGNVGPGLGILGPSFSYFSVPTAGKWIFSLCMLLGRLEIFTVLALFVPSFWLRR